MRTVFTLLIILVAQTSFGQNRKAILNRIQTYEDSLVLNTPYQVSEERLRSIIQSYLTDMGWEQANDVNTFKKTVAKIETRYDPCDQNVNAGRKHRYRYVSCRSKCVTEVATFTTSSGADYQLKTYLDPNQGYRGYGCRRWPTEFRPKVNELELRRYIYISLHGDLVDLPLELQHAVLSYNNRASEKRKLVGGVDF